MTPRARPGEKATVPEGATAPSAEARAQAAQDALEAAERRFRNTVERVADGILVVDGEGKIRFTNPAGERIFALPAASLIGSELGVPLVAGGTAEVDVPTPAGARVAELRIVETVWEDDDALLVSVRDITDRRHAEERERQLIKEQMARLQAEQTTARAAFLADASQVLVASMEQDTILCDLAKLVAEKIADHCVIDVALDPGPGRFARMVASRRPNGTVSLVDCIEAETATEHSVLVRRLGETGGTERVVAPGPAWIADASTGPDDEALWRSLRPAVVVAAPLRVSSGPLGMLAVVSSDLARPLPPADEALIADLAHRVGIVVDNVRLLRLAEGASRAKTDFLAIVSHELRTPLTGITGYAGLLLEELERPLTERERAYVDGILRSSDRLLGIIDQILLFARSLSGRDEVHYRTLPLAELMTDVAVLARPLAAEAGLEMELQLPPPDALVTTDAEMVRFILLHLLTNAIKFTAEGRVQLSGAVEAGGAVLRVTDTGRGISPDQLKPIFEPFQQTEPPHTRHVGGTGIGLSVVQNLVRTLRGELEVESAPGRGSTFTVRLPPSGEAAVRTSGTGPRDSGGSGAPR